MVKKKQRKTKSKKEKITKDMTFAKIINKYPNLVEIFFKHNMMCVGCPMAMQETIEQGALAHGIEPKKLVKELNKKLKKGNKE